MSVNASLWDHLPMPVSSVQPVPFENLGQNQGFMVYKTRLIGHKSGKLKVTELHDYATVFLNGNYIGYLDRREGIQTIDLPVTEQLNPELEILVEGMGHINFAQEIIDRKGITDRVSLNGMTLMNWKIYQLPMDQEYLQQLGHSAGIPDVSKPGVFFSGTFDLTEVGDTYFDLSGYKKGVVWVNGHNLGRFWEIGPQKRLFCPAIWLKEKNNEIQVFDLHQRQAGNIKGFTKMN